MTAYLSRRSLLQLSGASLLTGCAIAPASPVSSTEPSWIPDEQKQDVVRAAMEKYRVPGVGMAVVEDGALAWEGAFGVTNIETGAPVENTTLFQAASLSKPLFTYVVLRMVDDGRIGLEDRLVDYYRPEDLAGGDWADSITVRHVLTHQTGLSNWRSPEDQSAKLDPAFEPGTAYSYSGEAFFWLQQVCETITGLGLHDLTDRYLFTPANLTDMAMLWAADRDDREIYGHILGDDGEAELADLQFAREHGWRLNEVAEQWGRPMRQWRFSDLKAAHAIMRPHTHQRLTDWPLWRRNRPSSAIICSASSLRTTPGDYARFLTLMMPGNDRQDVRISKDLRQMALETQTEPSEKGSSRPVGLGWSLEHVEGGTAYDHWGFNARQHVSMALGDTSNRRGIVIMTNGPQGNRLLDEIGPVLTGTDYRSFF
ncbi:MAG: serine hydrolase domain-containing protein [Pseudomonadota bacterium]